MTTNIRNHLVTGIAMGASLLAAWTGSALAGTCNVHDAWETSDGYVCGNRAAIASGVDGPTGNKAVGISKETGANQAYIYGTDSNNDDISTCYAIDYSIDGESETDTNGGCGLAEGVRYVVTY